ncbi:cyclic nucleotide-binding-like protein [Pelagophyceae sp. CCMP2097]|nr:cyclic nucleotide-binding-like protein [Pelagophyceae sp. CCMP2097]
MLSIEVYCRDFHVPADLAKTIRDFYSYLWAHQSDDGAIFHDLSASLKLKLHLAVKRRFITSCQLFGAVTDQRIIVRLVLALQQQILVPGEVSVAQGENGSIMYFVSRGALSVTILTENGSTVNIARLTDGDYFGEAAILDNGVRNATVRAETFAELYFLTRAA